MRLTLVIIIIFLLHIHLLHAFSLSSRFLRLRDDEIVTMDKRGGGAASGHASAHSSSSGGRASRGGQSTRSPYNTAGVIPVYAAGAMNHHNNVDRSHQHHNDGNTVNCICFSYLIFIICNIIIIMM
ncbi:uncharacterized protein LOC129904181 [Solanum dulcamara]|uniref:uncharacterized protein LOC129904181 n=1 Tax=Solanum dulcamara TaxID=45834 RepID=UPI00248551B3|nr:uncharacterized protein LOC129904181 [Solanum dulcamara]